MAVDTTNRNPYIDEDGNPRLAQSVVAFIDMLGFKQQLISAYQNGTSAVLLRRLLAAISAANSELRSQTDWSVKIFTDNIVIGWPIHDPRDSEFELGNTFLDIADYQLRLCCANFFIRGAISIGEHYMDRDIVFGNALIETVLLEKDIAKDPRIILGERAKTALKNHIEYYSEGLAPQTEEIWIDEDGEYFVNYLMAAWPDDTQAPNYTLLNCHREVVIANLNTNRKHPELFSKYFWAMNYHNKYCNSIPEGNLYRIDTSHFTMNPYYKLIFALRQLSKKIMPWLKGGNNIDF